MSGRTIGAVVGAAVGYFVPVIGVQTGFVVGSMLGSLLMPDEMGLQDQTGPRLNNLKVTSSTYGAPINKVYGAYRVGGNIIWSTPIKETVHQREEDGKGGEEYTITWYTYSIDMAIALCEGPISGVRKIWADSVKIYDMSEGGTTDAYRASEDASGPLTFHLGNSDEEIDWFLQANEADTPAYRNTAYITFNQFQLELFGNRIPNITAEVIADGYPTTNVESGPIASRAVTYCPSEVEDNEQRNPVKQFHSIDYDVILYNGGADGTIGSCRYIDAYRVLNNDLSLRYLGRFRVWDGVFSPRYGEQAYTDTPEQLVITVVGGALNDPYAYIEIYNFDHSSIQKLYLPPSSIPGGTYWGELVFYRKEKVYSFFKAHTSNSPFQLIYSGIPKDTPYDNVTVDTYGIEDGKTFSMYVGNGGEPNIYFYNRNSTYDCSISIRRKDKIIEEIIFIPEKSISHSIIPNMYVDELLNICYLHGNVSGVSYLHSINLTNQEYKIWTLPVTSQYFISFHVDNNVLRVYDSGRFKYIALNVLGTNPVSVSSICSDLFEKSNIDSNDYILTETDSMFVDGFVLDKSMSARAAISILQIAHSFDIIEEDFVLRTQARGKSSSKDILVIDQGANTDENIEHKKVLDTELPQKVTTTYSNKDIDYQSGSQSTLRIAGNSNNNILLELPIVLDDSAAKQICEINMFRAWNGKDTFSFSLPSTYIDIHVGDVVTLHYEDKLVDVRITTIIITVNNIIQCNAVRESIYTNESLAIAQNTAEGFVENELSIPSVTELKVLDAPTLDNQLIDQYGVYISASGFSDNWKGCTVFNSKNGGQDYTEINAIIDQTVNGSAVTALGDGPTHIWDLNNTVEVSVINGILTDTSMLDVLQGANYAMVGSEIIQFVDVTEDTNKGTYILSNLLRGRRGTEWATTSHVKNELFTMLDYNIVFSPATLNLETYYKGVTFGKYLDDAYSIINTYTGVNLKPFSVAQFAIVTDNDYGDTIKWSRRDRYISGHFRALPLSDDENYRLNIYNKDSTLLHAIDFTDEYTYTYSKQTKLDDNIVLGENVLFEVYQIGTYLEGYKEIITQIYDMSYYLWILTNADWYWRFEEVNGSTISYEEINGTVNFTTTVATTFEETGCLPNSLSKSVQTNSSRMQSGYIDMEADNKKYALVFWFNTLNTEYPSTILRLGYTSTTDVSDILVQRDSATSVFMGGKVTGTRDGYDMTIDPNEGWIQVIINIQGNNKQYFKNGVLLYTDTTGSTNFSRYLTIGSFASTGTTYDVNIDEIAIFDRYHFTETSAQYLYDLAKKETQ